MCNSNTKQNSHNVIKLLNFLYRDEIMSQNFTYGPGVSSGRDVVVLK